MAFRIHGFRVGRVRGDMRESVARMLSLPYPCPQVPGDEQNYVILSGKQSRVERVSQSSSAGLSEGARRKREQTQEEIWNQEARKPGSQEKIWKAGRQEGKGRRLESGGRNRAE